MQKKLLVLLLALLISGLYAGCTSGVLPGTDEPQADSTSATTSRVVMFEWFEGPACSRCGKVHPDIVRLREEYGFDELVILEEFPLDYGEYTGWEVYDVLKRYFTYNKYLGASGGYPAAYFNGKNQIVYYENGKYANYKAAIEAELDKPVKISISANYAVSGRTININGKVTNVSSETLSNLAIEAMVYENSVYSKFHRYDIDHVVRDIITNEESGEFVESLPSGESHEFSLISSTLGNVHDMSNIHVVVYVQSLNSLEILQAFYVE